MPSAPSTASAIIVVSVIAARVGVVAAALAIGITLGAIGGWRGHQAAARAVRRFAVRVTYGRRR
jgi:hypothetical protein